MALLMVLISVALTVVHGVLAFVNVNEPVLFTIHLIAACVWAVNIPLWTVNAINDGY